MGHGLLAPRMLYSGCHSRIVPSSLPPQVASVLPSGDQVTPCTQSVCPPRIATRSPPGAPHKHTILSAEAEATSSPLGRHATRSTYPVWPWQTTIGSIVRKFHSRTVALPEEASIAPSGDQRTQ